MHILLKKKDNLEVTFFKKRLILNWEASLCDIEWYNNYLINLIKMFNGGKCRMPNYFEYCFDLTGLIMQAIQCMLAGTSWWNK